MNKTTKKIVSVIGARPQFVKAAIVSKRIKEIAPEFEEILVHTGQHYDVNMSDVFFRELGIAEPDYFLNVGSGSHGKQTGKMLEEIEKVLFEEKPALVMVYGDTNTTLAGALAAAKLHIPVAHVEAGLRSFNRRMPEELNRILTDQLSDFLFSPTGAGIKNLEREGYKHIFSSVENLPGGDIPRPLCINIGDVMFDIALEIKKKVDEAAVLNRLGLEPRDFILVTIHRADNTDIKENLSGILDALVTLAASGKTVYFPVHPRTRAAMEHHGLLQDKEKLPGKLFLAEPVPYMDMVVLESNARVIISDSGGVQKESYFFDTPCVIAREQTEWVELAETGWNVLTGANKDKITDSVSHFWDKDLEKSGEPLFGHGDAAEKIAKLLKQAL